MFFENEAFFLNFLKSLWSHPTAEHIAQSMNPVRTVRNFLAFVLDKKG
jgi:hypothetical protein